jgi:hypothetical protein
MTDYINLIGAEIERCTAKETNPIESLSFDYLNPQLLRLITNLSDTYQTSRDYVTASMFAATSAAIGKRVTCYDGKYTNVGCLWLVLIGRSGVNKSEPLKQLLNPLLLADAAEYKAYKAALKEWAKNGANEAEKPTFKQCIIGDSTPESRYQLMERNDLLLYSDEIRTFFDNCNRYAKSGEVSQLLSIWDGRQFSINRKGDDPLLIESPFMSIVGTCQPSIITDILSSNQYTQSGFIQRMLFVFPNTTEISKYKEMQPDTALLGYWNELLMRLREVQPTTLLLDSAAKKTYISYFDELQELKKNADDYTASVLSKLQIYVERWAVLTHMLNENPSNYITLAEMTGSIRAMRYFQSTAEKVKGILSEPTMRTSDVMKELARLYPSLNQSGLARALGVTQQAVNKNLKN